MKNIILLSTGGTIASTAGNDGRSIAGALPGDQLMPQVQVHSGINLRITSLFQKPSNAITLADLCTLHTQCQTVIDTGQVSGIVITHGTDTLEDTAYFLETTLDLKGVTVVVTGSQRVPHAMGTDAYTNLQNAIHAAADNTLQHTGVLVTFNESIFSAASVRKVSSFQLNGFASPGLGCLGVIDNGSVILYQRPVRLPTLTLPPGLDTLPDVDIVTTYLGARTTMLDAAVSHGAPGIIIEGVGRGHVPPDWMPAVQRAIASGTIVLICTAALHGPLHQSYTYTGSLNELEHAGAIGISGLPARKARLRLAALLAQGIRHPAAIRAAFTPVPPV